MHVVYIDDSKDQLNNACVYCALLIPEERWLSCFQDLKNYRQDLKRSDGIFVQKELHAWKLVSGRGRIANEVVTVKRRGEIFHEMLSLAAGWEDVLLTSGVFPENREDWLFERLLNRINRTMRRLNSHAILMCDEGKNEEYTRMVRRMSVHNPIPSRYGVWRDSGDSTENIPLDRIIEDPVFKDSGRSYFIQLVDFCAFALLRREFPLKNRAALHGISTAFNLLSPIFDPYANTRDPERIIRP